MTQEDNTDNKPTPPTPPGPASSDGASSSPPATAANASTAPAANGSGLEHMIPKDRFDKINQQRKAAEELAATKAEEMATLSGRLTALESTLAAERRQRQALEAATAAGIGEWAEDLRGETAEELAAHAAIIKERIETRLRSSTAGTPAPMGGRPAPTVDLDKLNDPKWVSNNPKAALQMEITRQRQNGSS